MIPNSPITTASNNTIADSLITTVSHKTHLYEPQHKRLHISIQDLFGKAEYGGVWFENAFNYLETVGIRVRNKDTGNTVEFSYYCAGVYRGQRTIDYRFAGNYIDSSKPSPSTQWLEVTLRVWESEEELRSYIADNQGVSLN